MNIEVSINAITGQGPYNVYICQGDGTGCFFINTISETPYDFLIPYPYNMSNYYMLKIIDNNNCIISGKTLL